MSALEKEFMFVRVLVFLIYLLGICLSGSLILWTRDVIISSFIIFFTFGKYVFGFENMCLWAGHGGASPWGQREPGLHGRPLSSHPPPSPRIDTCWQRGCGFEISSVWSDSGWLVFQVACGFSPVPLKLSSKNIFNLVS